MKLETTQNLATTSRLCENRGLTPSTRHHLGRHHRHLLCRRLLPRRRLPRLALVERLHRLLPSDQRGLRRGILGVLCSCLIVRLVLMENRTGASTRPVLLQ